MKPEKDMRYIGYWLIFTGMLLRLVGSIYTLLHLAAIPFIVIGLIVSFKLENNSKKALGCYILFAVLFIVSNVLSSSMLSKAVTSVSDTESDKELLTSSFNASLELFFNRKYIPVFVAAALGDICYLFFYRFLMKDCGQIGILRGKTLHADKCSINSRWYTRGIIIAIVGQIAMFIVAFSGGEGLIYFIERAMEYSTAGDTVGLQEFMTSYGSSMSGKTIILAICSLAYFVGLIMAGITHLIGVIRVGQTANMGMNPEDDDRRYGY